VQFEPGSEQFQVGRQLPGYRWLRLGPDGSVETAVSRLPDFDYQPDAGVEGY
jgi:Icc protein